MKYQATFIALIFSIFIGFPSQSMAGKITGNVTDDNPKSGIGDVSDIHVEFIDALNAERLTFSVTGGSGAYNSGILSDGNYRIRFTDKLFSHAPGFYISEFSGASGQDSFCSASKYTVTKGSNTVVDESMAFTGPVLTTVRGFSFSGIVMDTLTGLVIPDIKVSFLNGENGEEVASRITGEKGGYAAKFDLIGDSIIRVRFSDPAGNYFPEFSSTAIRSDNFCLGEEYSTGSYPGTNSSLDPIPDQAGDLITIVENLNLPGDVTTSLGTPLTRATDILTDDNASNDMAACGQLNAFISRVNLQERKGQLTEVEADTLRQASESAKTGLGCP